VTKADRLFRSIQDLANSMEVIKQRGIVLHILNMGIDLSTPYGRAFLQMSGVFGELEREMTGDRTKEVCAWKIANGFPVSSRPPYGWAITGKKRLRQFVVNMAERQYAGKCSDNHVLCGEFKGWQLSRELGEMRGRPLSLRIQRRF
jgi:DNA invertase Pin-like site-specific DNA recombinase